MSISMPRPLLVQAYCCFLQAERSLAFGLGADWTEFLAYFQGDRSRRLLILQRELQLLQPELVLAKRRQAAALARCYLSWLVALGFGHWKHSWRYPAPLVARMVTSLNAFIDMLESGHRPIDEAIIAMRMELCHCRSAIETWSPGMREISQARWLEHFRQAPWVKAVKIEELLGTLQTNERIPA